jgi:hypothetical protein
MSQNNIENAIDKELFEFRKQLEVLKTTTNPLLAAVRAVEMSRDISVLQVEQLQELADSYVTFVEDVKQASILAIESKLQELDTNIENFILTQSQAITSITEDATNATTKAISTTEELSGKFEQKLDEFNNQAKISYENKLNEFKTDFTTFVTDLKVELNQSVSTLNDNTKNQEESHNSLIISIKAIIQSNNDLITSNTEFVNLINGINFPSRLDKIDNTVSGINIGIQNTQTKVETIDRELKDKIEKQALETDRKIESSEHALNMVLTAQNKQIKVLKIFLWVSIGLTVIMGLINMIYK